MASFGGIPRRRYDGGRRKGSMAGTACENLLGAAFSQPASGVVSQRCRHMPAAEVIRASLLWQHGGRAQAHGSEHCAAPPAATWSVRQRWRANRPSAGEQTGTHCEQLLNGSGARLAAATHRSSAWCTANPRCVIESLCHHLRASSARPIALADAAGPHAHRPADDAACLFLSRCSAPGVGHWRGGEVCAAPKLTDPALNRRCWVAWLLGQAVLLADYTLHRPRRPFLSNLLCPQEGTLSLSLKAVAGWDVGRFWFHRAVATI
ncbi:uncharacterized protein CC84DRAFT_1248718 [Paraphaeosphaeria sporulosa]|uniref:Uncharacterized protein n=1 Tax=Paraphaeosphaeria sporulosa TaxID=1460663 RepID=A0A177C9V5_9PLEO|nr:uncharacterized protein CC84DRAFT_1248718 [Paraphaeosphaeria sporulosa]OAG03537.1 hypothetical protein CC84DRAFT_1248718 [Paraphaeosphaeria sporulosa]